jgi:hypothetical protein
VVKFGIINHLIHIGAKHRLSPLLVVQSYIIGIRLPLSFALRSATSAAISKCSNVSNRQTFRHTALKIELRTHTFANGKEKSNQTQKCAV